MIATHLSDLAAPPIGGMWREVANMEIYKLSYTAHVANDYHPMDAESPSTHSEFQTHEVAIKSAQIIVDGHLDSAHTTGLSVERLDNVGHYIVVLLFFLVFLVSLPALLVLSTLAYIVAAFFSMETAHTDAPRE